MVDMDEIGGGKVAALYFGKDWRVLRQGPEADSHVEILAGGFHSLDSAVDFMIGYLLHG